MEMANVQQSLASQTKLLEAALSAIRRKGYAATTVEAICDAAGVTKGSFFHHFRGKEDLVLQAVGYWNRVTDEIFAEADFAKASDPRDRLLGYVDFRVAILDRDVSDFTCLLGTLVQETYQSHPAVRAACDDGMSGHIAMLTTDIAAAKALYAASATWTPDSVAHFMQAVLQGSFIFAKARLDAQVARDNLGHLRAYLTTILPNDNQGGTQACRIQ
jgi:TetR/AcrR family transcriptional repressor of nem operon